LCGCAHGERNAIANAAKAGHETFGCYMFCWCGIPCLDCAVSIINAGITKVYCHAPSVEGRELVKNAYNFDNSRWQFSQSGVEVIELDRAWILQD
jgi:deoxycytidylate deaminase